MQIFVYRATDSHGYQDTGVVGDEADTIFLCGLKDKNGEHRTFESEPRHLDAWAKEFDFKVERYVMTVDLDKMNVQLRKDMF